MLMTCENLRDSNKKLHLLTSQSSDSSPFLIMFNTLSEYLDPKKHHVQVAMRDQHIQESPNHNTGGIHPESLQS